MPFVPSPRPSNSSEESSPIDEESRASAAASLFLLAASFSAAVNKTPPMDRAKTTIAANGRWNFKVGTGMEKARWERSEVRERGRMHQFSVAGLRSSRNGGHEPPAEFFFFPE